ncbi:SNF2 family N-terminal domain-containing protein [Blastocladiella britannica]|nr:SNF2 family N-terminal domain-containing protein [Blastocladiella britannica]
MSRHHRAGNDDNDELGSLRAHLGVGIQAADELEHEVVARASAQMNALSTESDRRRLDKLDATIEGVYDKMSALEDRIERAPVDKRGSLRRQLRSLTDSLPGLLDEQSAIQARIRDRTASDNADLDSRRPAAADALASISRVPAASDRERLLREGKITPFATDEEVRRALAPMNATGPTGGKTAVSSIRRDFVDFSDTESREDGQIGSSSDDGEDDDDDVDIVGSSVPKRRRRPIAPRSSHHRTHEKPPRRSARRGSNDSDGRSDDGSGSFVLSGADGSADGDRTESDDGTAASSPDHRPAAPTGTHYAATTDDGDETHYRKRLRRWATFHRRERLAALPATASGGGGDVHDTAESDDEDHDLDPESEVFVPGATADLDLGGGLRVPGSIHPHLFQYQRTCLSWLWELHQQKVGGIIGDEMGLGKTTQTVSFLASLVYSRQLGRGKPVLIVCPATVMAQWVKEFHQWFPPMRVVVLHASGAGAETSGAQNGSSSKKRRRQGRYASTSEEELEDFDSDQEHAPRRKPKKSSAKSPTSTYGDFGDDDDKVLNARYDEKSIKQVKSRPWVRDLVNRVTRDGHIVITTYGGIRGYAPDLLGVQWGYAVLDEGHKIRNPDSAITILCKQLKTPHRIILSGTPIQNNLAELWSLFDWVYPGRLGTLPVFQTEFAVPINIGGYANASNVQIQTAYKCACVLRDLIQPFILRRLKADVAQDLPTKSEQVLFCKLTRQQRELYRRFLASSDAESILQGKLNSLYGIDALRKICNHPKLHNKDLTFDPELSGKLVVVRELLRLWHDERHKVLLFCQTRQMLDVIQHMVVDMKLKYSRMDGTTPVKQRPVLVDQFNNDPSHFVFLLTTKVGGLGVNLTGANRIIIYDPDWNPATDAQARERAWRLGQTRHVTIYRLMTTGTIEEKIYHRQIFKQHLSSKVLSDPKQRRYFKLHDLNDLFTLGDEDKVSSETSSLARSSAAAAAGRNDDDLVAGLEGVARLEDFHQPDGAATSSIIGSISASSPSTSSSSSARTAASGAGEDARILSTLLGSSTVATAIQHDAVMAESRPEFIIVEREAQKVAAAAVAALRASRGTRRGQDVSVPTWTGRSGGGPGGRRFGSKAGAGAGAGSSASGSASPRLSSASLLQNLRERGGGSRPESPRDGRPAFASTTAATVSLADISQQELIVQIRDYLASVGGTAPSGDIVRHFKLKLTANDVATFRAMLTAIATFKKHLATGWWTLKDEFKD